MFARKKEENPNPGSVATGQSVAPVKKPVEDGSAGASKSLGDVPGSRPHCALRAGPASRPTPRC